MAAQLIAVAEPDRAVLLQPYAADVPAARTLAAALKQAYDESYSQDLAHATAAASVLAQLAVLVDDDVVAGFSAWTAGFVAMDEGRLAEATDQLAAAAALFTTAGALEKVIAVQVGQMPALAMQGRYDEALAVGLAARAASESVGDLLMAGKIEQNLGNLHFVRHRYGDAETLYRQARLRFVQIGDRRQLAQIDNCLATTLTSQHRFAEAEAIYDEALQYAEADGLEVTLAEIECNLGCLALFQGRYDRALDCLERSRRRYAALGMPHELAIAEQELADAYLELNMLPEAVAIYERVAPRFAALGMPGERARALAYHGRAAALLGQLDQARALLAEARRLYAEAAMPVGQAITLVAEAQLHLQDGVYSAAKLALAEAEPVFGEVNAAGWRLEARWLQGVVARLEGQLDLARQILTDTAQTAAAALVSQIEQRCASELGFVALAAGDAVTAEGHFRKAVALIEAMRAPLPAEEFRMGFLGDKLAPYAELVRLCVADGAPARLAEALDFVERSRARGLVDVLEGAEQRLEPRDPYEGELAAQIQRLRGELNWFYSQLNRPEQGPDARSGAEIGALHVEARAHETAILELRRQLQQRGLATVAPETGFALRQLQSELGADTALVEYVVMAQGLLAFVITGGGLEAVPLATAEDDVNAALTQFQFQLGALRHGSAHLRRHMPALIERTRQALARLYDLLLRPLAPLLADRRLVVAPHRSLHYVPFHALHDGNRYVVETREVCVTPSATLLQRCLAAPQPPLRRAVLLGLPDAYAPHVADEIATIGPLFEDATVLLDGEATRARLEQHAPAADLVHLACHGRFRSDSPFFSSLRLADGWMTVHDAYALKLDCALVTLSACETGLHAVAPGDDLVGLARGFFLAGAPSLLVSLWMVNDAAAAELMASFYRALLDGMRPAAALRHAQCELLVEHPHPFLWSPFVLLGRW